MLDYAKLDEIVVFDGNDKMLRNRWIIPYVAMKNIVSVTPPGH